jgi:uncharacterized protein (DUF1800 family)
MALLTERQKIAHLLRRFALGASEAELDYYCGLGLNGTIDSLINYENTDEGFDVPISKFQSGAKMRVNLPQVQQWWVLRLLATRRPLQEKMTLFWHNHFATSGSKVNQPVLMYQQNQVLRENATGKFQDLLMAVSKDPAMLIWLDNQYNVAGKANENFAREVMELFTLGIGHYTEKDIQESARAFTGWAYRRDTTNDDDFGNGKRTAVFFFRPRQHDNGEKHFMGQTGSFGGEDIIGFLCQNPQTSKFIAKKLWAWFAYPNPSTDLVDRVSEKWYRSGLDIKVLLKTVMESPEFYSEKAERHIIKNPVDFVVAPMRQLGIGAQLVAAAKTMDQMSGAALGVVALANQAIKDMGMPLLFPPDVSGWEIGQAWITSATMVERMDFGPSLFGDSVLSHRGRINYDTFPLFQRDLQVENVVSRLVSLFDADLPTDKVRALNHCAMEISQGAITEQNSNHIAGQVSRLIFGCPEYQLA